jgi:PASTA domain
VSLVVAAPPPRVPSVVGKPETSAIRTLKNAGFTVKKTTQTRTTGKDGVVLSQSPSSGTRAKPNSVVRVVISNVQRSPDTGESRNCTPGYAPCLPPASDYDCEDGKGNGPKYTGPVRVTGSDPYYLDRDGDGKHASGRDREVRSLVTNRSELTRRLFRASLLASDTSIEAALEPVQLRGHLRGRLRHRQPICCPTLGLDEPGTSGGIL